MIYSDSLTIEPLDPLRFENTLRVLHTGVTEAVAPGMVAGFWSRQRPGQVFLAAVGHRRLNPDPQPMELDTVFDLASVSKVFATATLIARLVERGMLSWETSVKAIFPNYPSHEIRISHLLAHTSGLPAWEPLWERMRERFAKKPLYTYPIKDRQKAMRELVFAIAPSRNVGESVEYSDIGFLLLGFVIEEITGLPLDRAVKKFLWTPMGLCNSFYRPVIEDPSGARIQTIAATEDCPWRGGVLQGQVHDDNCWAMGGFAGHAGAFADAREVLFFSSRLLRGFLSPEVLRAAWHRPERPLGCDRTLGWDTPSGSNPAAGRYFSAQTVGHLGFTGTSLWIDPAVDLAVVLLTNRVHPSRENPKIKPFRARFHNALRQELVSVGVPLCG